MKLNHIALWTTDLESSARFWRDDFDAQIGEKYEGRNRPGFVSRFITLPNSEVRIEPMEGPWVNSYPREASGWAHIACSVGSTEAVDALAERFRIDGLLISPPRRTGDGYYEAVIRSPDGATIEIVE